MNEHFEDYHSIEKCIDHVIEAIQNVDQLKIETLHMNSIPYIIDFGNMSKAKEAKVLALVQTSF